MLSAVAEAVSLLRRETVFFLSDLVLAGSDLGVVMDTFVHGIPITTALVLVMATLFLLGFHMLHLWSL